MSDVKIPKCIQQSQEIAKVLLRETILKGLGYVVEVKIPTEESETSYVVSIYSNKIYILPWFDFVFYKDDGEFFFDTGLNYYGVFSPDISTSQYEEKQCYSVDELSEDDAIDSRDLLKIAKGTMKSVLSSPEDHQKYLDRKKG